MLRLCDRRVLLILLLTLSGVLNFAARQGLIDIPNGYAEFINVNLCLLCGVLFLILHFVRTNGEAWYFGLIGFSIFTMPFEGFSAMNLGLLFLTSTVLVIFIEAMFFRNRAIHQH